jgi:hypothetical protein
MDNDNGFNITEIERRAFIHALAGFDVPRYPAFFPAWWPGCDQWPKPGRAYIVEMLRREYNEEIALRFRRTSPLFNLH